MAQFDIGDVAYQSRRLPAMTELHVTRRLAPVINGMLPQMLAAVAKGGGGAISVQAMDLKEASSIATAFVDFIAKMPDADANFVIAECCMVTERKQGEAWSKIWTRGAPRPQFDDIRFPAMAMIVFNVVKEAVVDFMPSLGLSSSAGAPGSSTSTSASPTS